ncbi:MAG TPA: hydrogenase maturation protease [Sideroxyarcus sp.]|nr:hydrogenase maturation protease [Sideroxyarcus sp.]
MGTPVLIFAVGNESRGDDAAGPLLARQLDGALGDEVELLEDYQLQIEHVADLAGRERVLFVDADVACAPPFQFSAIAAAHDNSYTSHAMTPAALLHAYRQIYKQEAPPACLLRIRGYEFELGAPMSGVGADNLAAAAACVRAWLAQGPETSLDGRMGNWRAHDGCIR